MNEVFKEACTKIENYRDFILLFLEHKKKLQPKYNFSLFAKKAGFSSRSFAREVCQGTKRLSATSLEKFIKAMELQGELKNYFILLVNLDQPEIGSLNLTSSEILSHLKRSRLRLKEASGKSKPSASAKAAIYRIGDWPLVYAALDSEKGSTVKEISERTGLSSAQVMRELKNLAGLHMIYCDIATNLYHSQDNHIFLHNLDTDQFFKNYILNSFEKAKHIVDKGMNPETTCFYNSTFSIKRSDLAKLCVELRSTLYKYIDKAEAPLGDSVVNLTLAFWNESDYKSLIKK
ncbi:MAG: TIGR02147 family protein [Oligoflexales bacterium]|nr:TIGR02147 family protein [Oligoflexales bacterium]